MFNTRNVGKTLVTRTQGTKVRRGAGGGGGGPWRGGVLGANQRGVVSAACSVGLRRRQCVAIFEVRHAAAAFRQQAVGRLELERARGVRGAMAAQHTHVPAPPPAALTLQIASDGLKGRVVNVSLADLQNVSAIQPLTGGGGGGSHKWGEGPVVPLMRRQACAAGAGGRGRRAACR